MLKKPNRAAYCLSSLSAEATDDFELNSQFQFDAVSLHIYVEVGLSINPDLKVIAAKETGFANSRTNGSVIN